jgi:hypothetical protein
VLWQVARASTPAAQLTKVNEITAARAKSGAKAIARGLAGRKKGGLKRAGRVASNSMMSSKDKEILEGLLEAWNDTPEPKRGFSKASQLVRDIFYEKIQESGSDDDDLEADSEPTGHDEEGDETQQDEDIDWDDDADYDNDDDAKPQTTKGKKGKMTWSKDDDDDNDEDDESDDND